MSGRVEKKIKIKGSSFGEEMDVRGVEDRRELGADEFLHCLISFVGSLV